MTAIIILLVIGAVLLFLETLLPGLVAGGVGLICLGVAVVLGYRDFGASGGNLVLGIVLVGWCWAAWPG